MYTTVGELRFTLCTKTPLYVRSDSYIKQMPLEHLSYIKQMQLEHLSYIKETLWNTSGHTYSRTEFTHSVYRSMQATPLTSSTFLQTQLVEDLVEFLLVLGEVWDLDVDSSTQPGTQVAGTGQHVTQMLIPHEVITLGLHGRLKLGETLAEATEHLLDVPTLLHGDDAQMIFLIHPHKEGLLIVVPEIDQHYINTMSTAAQTADNFIFK